MTGAESGEATYRGRVLSLCDKSGNALLPWAEAGYECIAVDHDAEERTREVGDGVIRHVQADVREYEPPEGNYVHAFAWPPCTDLAVSGARWFTDKGLGALAEAIEIVAACVDVLQDLECPWLLENPKSTLSTHWRSPDHTFDPYEYAHYVERDESYSKETWLWTSEDFRMPVTDGVPASEADDRIHTMPPSEDRAEKRAETPLGFARAVFLAFQEPEEYARQPEATEQKQLVADGGERQSAATERDDVVSKNRHPANSARGEEHLDDRRPLAYVYDGEELVAKLHKREVVEEFEDEESFRWYTVSRTPHGDEVLQS